MYGQFHHSQSIRSTKTSHAEKNIFLKDHKVNFKTGSFISLLLICLSFSSMSFAGSKQPKLSGGNGNAQGR